jgi:hypothetical protein
MDSQQFEREAGMAAVVSPLLSAAGACCNCKRQEEKGQKWKEESEGRNDVDEIRLG